VSVLRTAQWNKRRQGRRSLKITFGAGDDNVAKTRPVQEAAGHKPATRRRRQRHPGDDAIIDQAHALYGRDAATAVAYCGLDAWFEGEEVEYRRFARLFRRLMN
jgi:hypothetical protein